MIQIKIGVQLACLRQTFKKALLTAARLGAKAVEIDARTELRPSEMSETGARQVRKMLEDLDLRVCAIRFNTRRGYDVLDDLDRRVEATKKAIDMAFQLRAPVVVNHVGRVPDESSGPNWDALLETLSDIGRYGQYRGATLAARTGAEDADDLARLIEALPPGALVVDFDPGNLIINGFSAADAARRLGQHIQHVHARDGVRDLAQGRGIEVPLGRGAADFQELVAVLEEFGYQGYFTVERQNAADPIAEVGDAIAYLRNMMM